MLSKTSFKLLVVKKSFKLRNLVVFSVGCVFFCKNLSLLKIKIIEEKKKKKKTTDHAKVFSMQDFKLLSIILEKGIFC
jgi:hypothetical protein